MLFIFFCLYYAIRINYSNLFDLTSLQIQLEIVCFIREESSVWFGKSVIFIDYDISNHTTGYIQCVIDESVAGSFKLPFI